jgi:hypothetical protein
MKLRRSGLGGIVVLAAVCMLSRPGPARADLQWQSRKKESLRIRLIALAWNHPRSSFFANQEVFIAEKELGQDEARLVKLVYGFLPYQPRLSDYGLDYSTIHELHARRDPDCDETVAQMTSGQLGDWRQENSHLKYSTDAPALNLQRPRAPLPCYITSADDYNQPVPAPTNQVSPTLALPTLRQ